MLSRTNLERHLRIFSFNITTIRACPVSYLGTGIHINGLTFAAAKVFIHLTTNTVIGRIRQRLNAVEVRVVSDTVDLVQKLIDLALDICSCYAVVRTVCSLGCQSRHTLQHGVRLSQSTFCRLNKSDGVVCIAHCLIQTVDLRSHSLGNCQTCCVIACTVDLVTGRQFL